MPLLRIGGERVGGVAGWPDYDGLAAKTIEWNGTNYAGLAEFSRATGLESRGVPVSGFDRFERVEPPDDRARTFQPGELDSRLRAGRIVVDAGCALPNVNDSFDGMAPDLGALERGRPATSFPMTEPNFNLVVLGGTPAGIAAAIAAALKGICRAPGPRRVPGPSLCAMFPPSIHERKITLADGRLRIRDQVLNARGNWEITWSWGIRPRLLPDGSLRLRTPRFDVTVSFSAPARTAPHPFLLPLLGARAPWASVLPLQQTGNRRASELVVRWMRR